MHFFEGEFGCFEWSPSETKLLYIAEKKRPKTASFFNAKKTGDRDNAEKEDSVIKVQWNPSCEATPFALEKWPFKRGGLLPGVAINTFYV